VLEILKDDENWGGAICIKDNFFATANSGGLVQDVIHANTHKLLLKLGL